MANFARISGKVYLRADNNNWHLISSFVDPSINLRVLQIDQTPITSPGLYDEYSVITADNALNYKFSLVSGAGDELISSLVAQTPTGDAGITGINLPANDGLYYPLNLVSGTGEGFTGIQYSIGPRIPIGTATLGGSGYFRADDGNWYLMGAYIDTGLDQKTVDIAQTPLTGPTYGDEFAILTADDGLNYKFSLVTGVDLDGSGYVGYDIAQTATGEVGVSGLNLIANDGFYYPLTLVNASGTGILYEIGEQIPSAPVSSGSLEGYITGSFETYVSRLHQLTTGINTLYGFELEGDSYRNMAVFPLYQAQRIMAQQANILTANQSGYYYTQFFTGRRYF